MNDRVLEVTQSPNIFLESDLVLFKSEIEKFPYIQSIRATYLLGILRFQPEHFQEQLSITAAYTTDKKILYQLIHHPQKADWENVNGEDSLVSQETLPHIPLEHENPITAQDSSSCEHAEETCVIQNFYHKKYDKLQRTVFINGERNRILFEGEENFMNEPERLIDIESSLESGEIVLEDAPIIDNKNLDFKEESQNVIPPTLEENSSAISFHQVDEFHSSVVLKKPTNSENKDYQPSKKDPHQKYQDEMQKLIAEVEQKMKPLASPITQEEEEQEYSHVLNFSETHEPIDETLEKQREENIMEENELKENLKTEERPEISISFLENDRATPSKIITQEEETKQEPTLSNVPQFINTWQKWLQIDREEHKKAEIIPLKELKTKVIDKFIETEPKISRLKENSEFSVKEKPTDVSHLMTETLAQLYFKQKLYSKAVNAYEILKAKHPEKSVYFEEKIREIKETKK